MKFLDGYPGKYVVVARRSGNRWFISGINGDSNERTVKLDLTTLNIKSATLFTDAANGELFSKKDLDTRRGTINITLKANGGFVMVSK